MGNLSLYWWQQFKKNTQLFTLPNKKIENPILCFLIFNFAIEFTSFSKEQEFNNGFGE